MNKRFEVRYSEANNREETITKSFPTFEEAEDFAENLFDEGWAIVPKIFEIRI